MEKDDDPGDIERKLAQVTRLSSSITDEPTVGRFRALAEELRQKLQGVLAGRKARLEERAIRARANQIWEEHGRPEGRDVEFWLQAEREIKGSCQARKTYGSGSAKGSEALGIARMRTKPR